MQLLRQLLLSSILLFFAVPNLFGQDTAKSMELRKILNGIAQQHGVKFSYIEEDISHFNLVPPPASLPLKAKLNYLTTRTGISYREAGNYIAIFIDNKLPTPKICGYLRDENKDPVQDASISYDNDKTITTDTEGYFEISSAEEKIVINHPAFYSQRLDTKDFGEDCREIILITTVQLLDEVVTERYLTTGISRKKDGSFIIKPRQFGILPGLIEPDLLMAMQQLPGINSIDETVSNINVRGGTHDQNLFMWNGIRLFQTGHFFGLISALNPNLANEIRISKNGTSAFFGESVSSTVYISSRSKNIEEGNTIIGSNMINAEFYTKLKPWNDANIELSARRSFTDVLDLPTYSKYSKRIFQNTIVTDLNNSNDINYRSDKEFYFYDFTAQYHHKIEKIHDLYADVLGITNRLDFTEGTITGADVVTRRNNLRQVTYGASVGLKSQWDEVSSTEITGYGSFYNVNATNESINAGQTTGQKNNIRDMGMKISGSTVLTPLFTLHGGYQFNIINIENYDAINTPYFPRTTNEALTTQVLVAEMDYNSKNGKLYTKAGLRGNYIDELSALYVEPRLQLNYILSGTLNLEVLAEKKSQTASQVVELQNDFLGIEKRRWVLANDDNIPIQKSTQLSAGLTFREKGWLVSVDNFYKKVSGITSGGQAFQNQLENVVASGDYTVIGTEFLIQKQFNNFYTWASYTWNDNKYHFDNISPVPNEFTSNFEIKHTVSSAFIYELGSLKIALGSKWFTGRPITTPAGSAPVFSNPESPQIDYSIPNSDNLDDFMQFNFSASYTFSLTKKARLQLGVSVLNIFNRQNIINRYYRINSDTNSVEVVNTYSVERTPNALIKFSF
ncbi:MAG: TonB-dependent receptor [Flavobacterium sp.]|nr:MAG: TonB-dependent receptor [Flavobacterium sp.]